MKDITKIPTDQLHKDREASIEDISNCNAAMRLGIFHCKGDSIIERRDVNAGIVKKIDVELIRREDSITGDNYE